ncbi:hypothetical protein J4470_05650 [Candidatus Woesearchaeota archaeon]|nr:hypothetical protein [Candidatus Woesearchaeota archaeon]
MKKSILPVLLLSLLPPKFLLPSNKLRGEGKKARANKQTGKTFNNAPLSVISS